MPPRLIHSVSYSLSLPSSFENKIVPRVHAKLTASPHWKPGDSKSKRQIQGPAALIQVLVSDLCVQFSLLLIRNVGLSPDLCPTIQSPKLLLHLFIPVYTRPQEIMNLSKILGDVHTL